MALSDLNGVKLDKLTVVPETGGFRLCIEGFVPHQAVPALSREEQGSKRRAYLETVLVGFPELVPGPWRTRTRL